MPEDVSVAEVQSWAASLEEVSWRIGPRFTRPEPRAQAERYLRGLLSGLERKNGWTLAEQAGPFAGCDPAVAQSRRLGRRCGPR